MSKTGPKGGQKQVTPGGFRRKGFYLLPEEIDSLRRTAFDRQVSESEIVREALRQYLHIEEEADEDHPEPHQSGSSPERTGF